MYLFLIVFEELLGHSGRALFCLDVLVVSDEPVIQVQDVRDDRDHLGFERRIGKAQICLCHGDGTAIYSDTKPTQEIVLEQQRTTHARSWVQEIGWCILVQVRISKRQAHLTTCQEALRDGHVVVPGVRDQVQNLALARVGLWSRLMAITLNILKNGIKRRSDRPDLRNGGVRRTGLLLCTGRAHTCSRLASGDTLAALH